MRAAEAGDHELAARELRRSRVLEPSNLGILLGLARALDRLADPQTGSAYGDYLAAARLQGMESTELYRQAEARRQELAAKGESP